MAFRLNRRDVLRGAGSIAIALPWLEAMRPEKTAGAAAANVAKRFIGIYQPGGVVMDAANDPDDGRRSMSWRPTGTETDFALSEILSPLESMRQKALFISGLNMPSSVGEQHQAGICALLTGVEQGSAGRYPSGPSLDQVLAPTVSAGKPRASVEVAVRWATGKSHGLLNPINSLVFQDNAGNDAISPRIDPQDIFDVLFGSLDPGDGGGAGAERLARKISVLDYVDKRYEALAMRLGANDKAKLDEHLTHLRTLEGTLGGITGEGCQAPTRVDTTGYNPAAGLNANDNGSNVDSDSDAMIPTVGKFMMDMLVMAMRCDITGVATLQWSDTEAKHTFPWLDLAPHNGEHHHYYQHDGGYRPVECAKIGQWYQEQHAYLLQEMDKVDMGGHTLLDEAVVFVGSEISIPHSHGKNDHAFLVAGGGGGLRGNRWLDYNGQPHNDLLAGILNLFGGNAASFGDPRHNTSPLNLT